MRYYLTRNWGHMGNNELDIWNENNRHVKRLTGLTTGSPFPINVSDFFMKNCTIAEAGSVEELVFFALHETLQVNI